MLGDILVDDTSSSSSRIVASISSPNGEQLAGFARLATPMAVAGTAKRASGRAARASRGARRSHSIS